MEVERHVVNIAVVVEGVEVVICVIALVFLEAVVVPAVVVDSVVAEIQYRGWNTRGYFICGLLNMPF